MSSESTDKRTSINLSEKIRDELRRYKADDGLTYDEAVAQLLAGVDWIENESELLPNNSETETDE